MVVSSGPSGQWIFDGEPKERHNVAQAVSSDLIETVIELMNLAGPTGQEEPVLAWCREVWSDLGADVSVSPIGNVTAHIAGTGPRLLLQGHADEISYVVKSIDDRGFIWLADGQAGASRHLYHRHPVGQPALIIGRGTQVSGLFATVTGHIVSTRPDEGPLLALNDVFVDVGAESREEAEALGVQVGAGVIWNPPARRIGHRVVGKAIDDRVALALMTHLLMSVDREELTYDLTLAATIQEEIGLIGATSLGSRGNYDLAIAIDNGPIGDYPGVDSREMPVRLGAGPTLVYKDSWTHYDRRVLNRLLDVAESKGIDVQQAVFPGFGSDGAALIRAGIPTALLGIATRYTHSPFEMADERDVCGALDLLKAFVTAPATPLERGPA
jgi:putative aminopeptidase FrvX